MKISHITFPLAAAALLLTACDDNVMEWNEPDPSVKPTELPMELAEKIAQYDYLKNYMAQYHPDVQLTVGMGLDLFLEDEAYRQTVLDNFQGVTFGNAMKHQSIVSSSGVCNWATVDRFLALNTGLPIHGHNLLWHTQQQQTYLKSLIAPTMVIESDPANDIQNMLSGDNSDFEGGTKGSWGSWGNESESGVTSPGHNSAYAMYLKNPSDASAWNAQCAFTFDTFLTPGVYKIRFYAKSDTPAGQLQFQYQNGTTYGSQGGYNTFNVGTDWVMCEHEFELTLEDVNRILLNFGAVGGTYMIDDVEFGLKQEAAPADPMANILPASASDFNDCVDGATGGWGSWGSNKDEAKTVEGAGKDGSTAVMLSNKGDGNAWEAQFAYTFDAPLTAGQPYVIQFEAKSTSGAGQLQFQYQNGTTYGSQGGYNTFNIGTDWATFEHEFTIADFDDVNRIILNFGAVGATYTIDNIKFGPKLDTAASKPQRASRIYYVLKTPEEKKAILLEAMEAWIKEAMEHAGPYCTTWDVINEAIGDNLQLRGVEGGWMSDDAEPVETETDGLDLRWANDTGNGHFYWGYYIGKEYGVKAFEYAAKYNPNGAKLFINDYNLETSPGKLNKLIEFVKYIDANGAHVDGIGTQMHVSSSITKEQVEEMFRTLAATGKLIRITELDVAIGTATPTVEQLQKQSDIYEMILNAFFTIVPKEQQSGVTIWSLSDNAKEHEYWLKDESPNIFDASYGRKIAYKGVADAIAGFDISTGFSSPDYSKK